MSRFLGFDHIDTRVRSLAAVEPFYDRLMAELGLPRKKHSYVDEAGDWHSLDAGKQYNVAEYFEEPQTERAVFFIGFIEDPAMRPVMTRIAFRVPVPLDVDRWVRLLREIGAVDIEPSSDIKEYPAIFFEDPAGTKLEITARSAVEP
jgi:catechol 2,3-dioxygenase-like lactoylglutathione lyase family enzyme